MELVQRNSQTETPGRTRAQPRGLLIFLCLLCFPPRRFSSQGRRPQNGSASTGKLKYSNASGPHTFFDIAPLKYSSWDDYQKGVKGVLAGYKSAKFTVNDDAALHPQGDLVWATATVHEEMTTKVGKVEMGNFRWTVICENEDGKWL